MSLELQRYKFYNQNLSVFYNKIKKNIFQVDIFWKDD